MPQVIPVIVTWLGSTAVTIAGYAVTWGTIIKIAIVAASIAYSSEQSRKMKRQLAAMREQAQGLTVTVRDPISPRRVVYGKRLLGGTTVFGGCTNGNADLHLVIALAGYECAGIDELYFSDELVYTDGSGNATGRLAGHVKCNRHSGAPDQAADADLMAAMPLNWTGSHTLSGIPYIYLKLIFDQEKFPSGPPAVAAVVLGRKVYDPRDATTAWSDNPALCLRDYLLNGTYGLGCDADEIDDASFIAAANICDEYVTAARGPERRYTLNCVIESSMTPADAIDLITQSMAGHVIYSGGKWRAFAGAYRAPTVSITLDDLRAPMSVTTADSMAIACNGVKGTFIDPLNGYQPADFPPVENALYLSEDQGLASWRDLDLAGTVSPSTSQRIAKIELEKARQDITINLPLNLSGLKLQAGDTFQYTNSRYGWTNKVFEVESWKLVMEDQDGAYTLGADVTARETAAGVYDWNDGEETTVDLAPNTTLPNVLTVTAPTNLTLTCDNTTGIIQPDGTVIPRVLITWTPPTDVFVTRGGKIWIQYKRDVDASWRDWAPVPGNQTSDYLTDIKATDTILVRIRAENVQGVSSSWVTSSPLVVSGDLVPPDAPSNLQATGVIGGVKLTYTPPTQADFDAIEIYQSTTNSAPVAATPATYIVSKGNTHTVTGLTGGEIYYFWVRALDTSRNKSAWSSGAWAQADGVDTELQQLLDDVAKDVAKIINGTNDNAAALIREAEQRNRQIVAEQTTRQTDIESLARDFAAFFASVGVDHSIIARETLVMVTKTQALARAITALKASFAGNTSELASELSALATLDSALASTTQTLTTDVSGIKSQANTLTAAYVVGGQAIATWGFKLDANGKVVGMQAIAASGGTQADTGVIVFSGANLQSDNFVSGTSGDGWRLKYDGGFECRYALVRDPSITWGISAPSISPGSQTFAANFTASVSAEAGATVRYTTGGDEVTEGSSVLSSGVYITDTTTLRVRAFNGSRRSPEVMATYTKATMPLPQVATPTFDGPAGAPGTLTIGCSTSGATVWYEKHSGSNTTGVRQYTVPFSVVNGDEVLAWGTKPGMMDSEYGTYINEGGA